MYESFLNLLIRADAPLIEICVVSVFHLIGLLMQGPLEQPLSCDGPGGVCRCECYLWLLFTKSFTIRIMWTLLDMEGITVTLCSYLLSPQDDRHHALWLGGLGALIN